MGCWKQFVWQPHLSLVTPVLLDPKNPLGGAGATTPQPFRPRRKILRFLLGLRRSSSCGRDCADGAVGTQTRESGLTLVIPVFLQLKNPLGEQELRHRSHFGQGERFCDFFCR